MVALFMFLRHVRRCLYLNSVCSQWYGGIDKMMKDILSVRQNVTYHDHELHRNCQFVIIKYPGAFFSCLCAMTISTSDHNHVCHSNFVYFILHFHYFILMNCELFLLLCSRFELLEMNKSWSWLTMARAQSEWFLNWAHNESHVA